MKVIVEAPVTRRVSIEAPIEEMRALYDAMKKQKRRSKTQMRTIEKFAQVFGEAAGFEAQTSDTRTGLVGTAGPRLNNGVGQTNAVG